jgi:isoquinoline 1-oxidoreductase beta subunit
MTNTPSRLVDAVGLCSAGAFALEASRTRGCCRKDPQSIGLLTKDQDRLLRNPAYGAHARCCHLAAEKAGWDKRLPAGRYRGVACFGCFASYMAEVVEISMENDQPRVHRVVAVVDCGQVVNPSILEQQIQGGIVYGLANALRAKITIEKGRVVQGNFDDYAPLRMGETPAVEVYAVPSQETPTGIGEPSVPPIAPALCNAIYAATKKRIRALPILS